MQSIAIYLVLVQKIAQKQKTKKQKKKKMHKSVSKFIYKTMETNKQSLLKF
jgi:hypothetical protein